MIRALTLLLLNLSVGLPGFANAPLSDSEADVIIADREKVKDERKTARIAELERAEVVSVGRGNLPNGQEVLVREVKPPVNIGATFMTPAEPKQDITPTQLAWMEQQQQIENHRVLMLSGTVYDRSVTRVSWTYESEQFVAYANADFNLLRGVMNVTTETDAYDFFMGIGDATRANNPYHNESIPPISAFSPDRSEYILSKGSPVNLEAISGLNALLAYYYANLPALEVEFQRREALVAAQKRYDSKHPKVPEPFIMQFYIPERSRQNRSGVDLSPRPNPSSSLAVE